jgi:hypothetical protein
MRMSMREKERKEKKLFRLKGKEIRLLGRHLSLQYMMSKFFAPALAQNKFTNP